jgi:SAM-dependent methyltransferase
MDRSARKYWDLLAQRWRFSAPLSPGPADAAWFEGRLDSLAASRPSLQALMLGVTPALAGMRWPATLPVAAVDWSTEMLARVWPASRAPAGAVRTCADWRQLPFAPETFDVAAGDGVYTALTDLAAYRLLNAELHRVLRPGGRVLVRCMCRPSHPLGIEALFEQLLAGDIGSLDLFRFLVAMTLYHERREPVARRDIGEVWSRRLPDARAHQRRLGWSDDDMANLARSATQHHTLCFPTLEEQVELWRPHFEPVAHDVPDYPWGGLFPRVELRVR